MESVGFSSVMKLTDLNDFITPSLECVKPVTLPSHSEGKSNVRGLIQLDDDRLTLGVSTTATPQKAVINLSDCLACSGCVTSAEVVLVTEQSSQQLRRALQNSELEVVVSLCPQAVLSLALKWRLTPQDCTARLTGYLKSLGVVAVWDTNTARSLALTAAADEVIAHLTKQKPLPLLASACPGWICYAEKTQTQKVLDHISRVRSPQQIMGVLVKKIWCSKEGKSRDQVFHVTVMPCYDKKLEASRKEFLDELTRNRDVDCVITSMELDQMLQEDQVDLSKANEIALSGLLSGGLLESHAGSSAGGYADYVLTHVAYSLYDTQLDHVEWKMLKNADLQEASLCVSGKEVFKACRAYGFRNLQNIVQKVKRGKSPYHYIEVMACPSGCLNGGAQIKPETGQSPKVILQELEALYRELPVIDPRSADSVQELKEALCDEPNYALTSYKLVEKSVPALSIKW